MSELKVYEVEINGNVTTVQLTAADAALRGLTDADTVEHRATAKRAAEQVSVKVVDAEAVKQRAAANKARAAANKGA
ncbi:Uncharacterised protein [Nocardia otitidiscaviarum]|uniref:Uncharacterized protein n=2 Tax=Nocardia otitidiscaviarum TaxID=1823 RepID=A0A378Y7E6_9NOCA|nr:Uncharacterised protein [Nocardia otitidiscaviarum]